MVDINHDQYKMLKRISKAQSIETDSLTDEEKKICDFLCENRFILPQSDWDYEESNLSYAPFVPHIKSKKYVITQAGKAQIYSFKAAFHKWWIPLAISILALIVSILKWLL